MARNESIDQSQSSPVPINSDPKVRLFELSKTAVDCVTQHLRPSWDTSLPLGDFIRIERLSVDGFVRIQRPDFMRFTSHPLMNAST